MQLLNPSTQVAILNCCNILDEKKALSIELINLKGKSSITDFFIVATGTSSPHLNALMKSAERSIIDDLQIKIPSQKDPESGWIVLDGFDFMVHLFTEELRSFYAIEKLWNDASRIDWRSKKLWV